jgi:hypothetical protein
MAVGINPVRRPQQQQRGRDPIDRDLSRILAAIQIGQSAFGIKESITADELNRRKIQAQPTRSEVAASQKASTNLNIAKTVTENVKQQKLGAETGLAQEQTKTEGFKQKKLDAEATKAASEAASVVSNKQWTRSKDLRNFWEKSNITQRSIRVSNSWKQIQQLAAQDTGGSDDAFIFLYNKMLDETSTVMPGEVERVSEAGSKVDRVNQIAKNWVKGTKLTAKVKQEFVEAGAIISNIQNSAQKAWNNEITSIANKNQLDSTQIVLPSIVDFGQQQQQTQFSEDAINQVMKASNVDRATAINRLKGAIIQKNQEAQGGTQ